MPFGIWRITIALLASPLIGAATLGPSVEGWTPSMVLIAVVATAFSWGLAALLLRHYGKWPWSRN
jgi:hypothetical protein